MLESLHIRDFTIIDTGELTFTKGFNVITGETGAGKSILIDAISLLLGARADSTAIRNGTQQTDISAIFQEISATTQAQLDKYAVQDTDIPTQSLLRRVFRDKTSKSFINGHPVTTTILREIGTQLVYVHGQNTHTALLKSTEQRIRLDTFAHNAVQRAAVAEAWQQWQIQRNQLAEYQQHSQKQQERCELLRDQIEEFRQIAPQEGEFDELTATQQLLSHADTILQTGAKISALLRESEPSATQLLHQAYRDIQTLIEVHADFSEVSTLLDQSAIYLNEACTTLTKRLGKIEHDPTRLADINARMSSLHTLARKYHITPETLYPYWQDIEQQYHELQQEALDEVTLQQAVNAAEQHYQAQAQLLHTTRKKAAELLASAVEHWIHRLGMKHAKFSITVTATEHATTHGYDEVTYLLCANPGQALEPLTKVASGGELSRIGLAIEVATIQGNNDATLIFDEIDAGIGGEIADTIGELLHTLGQKCQILCITHLPQVARWAETHFTIHKTSDGVITKTHIVQLDKDARVTEIARMLGDSSSKISLQHAKNMLVKRQSTAKSPINNP